MKKLPLFIPHFIEPELNNSFRHRDVFGVAHHSRYRDSKQSQYCSRNHKRNGSPCKERRGLFELFGVDAAADETSYQISDRRSEKPNSHHLADKTARRELSHGRESDRAEQ